MRSNLEDATRHLSQFGCAFTLARPHPPTASFHPLRAATARSLLTSDTSNHQPHPQLRSNHGLSSTHLHQWDFLQTPCIHSKRTLNRTCITASSFCALLWHGMALNGMAFNGMPRYCIHMQESIRHASASVQDTSLDTLVAQGTPPDTRAIPLDMLQATTRHDAGSVQPPMLQLSMLSATLDAE
jgi:hypothetical protein